MKRCRTQASLCALLLLAALAGHAQAPQGNAPAGRPSRSRVLHSRSAGGAVEAPAEPDSGPRATDAERDAVLFTAYDLDLHLTPQNQGIAVRARIRVRNAGDSPLAHLPLQLSSTLVWQEVRVAGQEAAFGRHTLPSDADHTGQVHEAVVTLPQPLAPGKELALDVFYAGRIALSARRLTAIGTPADLAQQSDWDRISPGFVGLRGFGNVLWYPCASPAIALGEGARLFNAIDRQKQRQSEARLRIVVTLEFTGVPPNVAILNGVAVPVNAPPPEEAAQANIPRVITCQLPDSRLGFATPSLFLASRFQHDGIGLHAYSRAEDETSVQAYLTAATMVTPMLRGWLGAKQKTPLTILDLPEAGDAPYETGSTLLLPLASAPPEQLAGPLCHALSHSYFQSPHVWLNEGVAHFMSNLWIEKTNGRDAAIAAMDPSRAALALAEPGSPGGEAGQDLIHAVDAVYYRTKASSVLWMLRSLAGDGTLSAALRAYDPTADVVPEYFERLLAQTSQSTDLHWFFTDWVYRDRGLPDLSIAAVYPSKASVAESYLVAVDVANDGYAEAEIPLTVRSRITTVTERMRIPARSRATRRIVLQGTPTEVILNDGTVPEVQASQHVKTLNFTGGE